MSPAPFITLEGGEGSGKSTQLLLLSEALAARGIAHITTREPGGTPGAESLRKLVVEGEPGQWDAMTETLLFVAARVDHVRKRILPALREGNWVLCDRFVDSTFAYQGAGKGVDTAFLTLLHRFALDDFMPDATFMLDIDPEAGLKRAHARQGHETRFEAMDMDFHLRVRKAFLEIAARDNTRCITLDATQPPEAVHRDMIQALKNRALLA